MAVTDTAAPSRRQSLARWLRFIVSAALLAVLVTKIHPADLLPERRTLSTLVYLAAGLILTALGLVLSAWRWQRVLEVFDVRVPLRTLTKHYFAGQFVGNVLPSTVGGDVVRVSRGATTTGSGSVAFDKRRGNQGNTLGCNATNNNLRASQHFFALKLTKDDRAATVDVELAAK